MHMHYVNVATVSYECIKSTTVIPQGSYSAYVAAEKNIGLSAITVSAYYLPACSYTAPSNTLIIHET